MGLVSIINFYLLLHLLINTDAADSGIRGWVSGVNKQTGDAFEQDFKQDSSSDIVAKDLKHLQINCEADFAVELDYEGFSDRKFVATGTGTSSNQFKNETHNIQVEKFTSYAFGLPYTGLYTCRGIEAKDKKVSAYVYIPTDHVFSATRSAPISTDSNPLQIPCAVSDPSAGVSLMKVQSEDTVKSVSGASYDPKKGFTLSDKSNAEGTYYCSGKYNNTVRAVEFQVIKGPVTCTQKCGPNQFCEASGGRQTCHCREGFEQRLGSDLCLKKCKVDSDCPSTMACVTIPKEEKKERHSLFDMDDDDDWGFGHHFGSFGSRKRHRDEDNKDKDKKQGECRNACVVTDTGCTSGQTCKAVNHKGTCH